MPFDPTKPVQLRNGWPARIYDTECGGDMPIQGAYINPANATGGWCMISWSRQGIHSLSGEQSSYDVINIPVKVTRYINIYRTGTDYYSPGALHWSAEKAALPMGKPSDFVATVKIEFNDPNGSSAATDAPKKSGRWVNIYYDGSRYKVTRPYASKVEAIENFHSRILDTVEIPPE